ncbi:MAG: AzlD domain-containing protein [Lachnospiraceae bacterium]|nr:AzlD domain-containing protein [Lachnospiraceae bacterium]
MQHNVWIYIAIMALVTYLIRMLPLTLLRKEIKNRTLRSFLYYVPYVTLTVMTFPAIITATGDLRSGAAGLVTALILSWKKQSLPVVAFISCAVVFLVSMLLTLIH